MWLRARGTREFCICSAPKLQGLHLTQHMVVLSILQGSSLGLSVLLTQSQGMPGSLQVTIPKLHPKLRGCQDRVVCLWEHPV